MDPGLCIDGEASGCRSIGYVLGENGGLALVVFLLLMECDKFLEFRCCCVSGLVLVMCSEVVGVRWGSWFGYGLYDGMVGCGVVLWVLALGCHWGVCPWSWRVGVGLEGSGLKEWLVLVLGSGSFWEGCC